MTQSNRQSKRRRRQEKGNGGRGGREKEREMLKQIPKHPLYRGNMCNTAADVPVQVQMTAQVCTNTRTYTLSQSEGERQK